MIDESKLLNQWEIEQPKYELMGEGIKDSIQGLLQKMGIFGELSYRIKETESLIKKAYRKDKTYEDIHDKVGVRVVVQFKKDLLKLDAEIQSFFGCLINKREDKTNTLTEFEFGYQSIHYDISNEDKDMFCELQIRTICQHNWSMMSHTLSYKKEKDIPVSIKRQINALSALFEVADTQFQSIQDAIESLENNKEIIVYNWIEEKFFSIYTKEYDHEMTNYFLEKLDDFYPNENIMEKLSQFYESEAESLKNIIISRNDNVFYTQPEIFIILERITNKKILFKSMWSELYPIQLLEKIANIWGTALD